MAIVYILSIHLVIFLAAAGLLVLASGADWLARRAGVNALHNCARWVYKAAQAVTLLLAACVIGTCLMFLIGFFRSLFG